MVNIKTILILLAVALPSCKKNEMNSVSKNKPSLPAYAPLSSEKKKYISNWYAHQKNAAKIINELAEHKIDIDSLDYLDPDAVLEKQHSAIGSISDITVTKDNRWDIIVRWHKEEIKALNYLKEIVGDQSEFNEKEIDLDLVFEAQQDLFEKHKKDLASP